MYLSAYAKQIALYGIASLAVMTLAAYRVSKPLSGVAAALFTVAIVAIGLRVNELARRQGEGGTHDRGAIKKAVMTDAAALSAAVYGWAAAVLFAVYQGVNLFWQHGWQYGLAFTLMAAMLGKFARDLCRAEPSAKTSATVDLAAKFAILHGVLCAAALLWLATSGKLATPKGDWAANHVFVVIAVSIAALSAFVVKTFALLNSANRI